MLVLSLAAPLYSKDKILKPGRHPPTTKTDKNGPKKLYKKLSLEEKIGQLFMPRLKAEFLSDNNPYFQELRDSITKDHVGSFIITVPYDPPFLYKTGPYEAAMLLNRLQRESKLPLIIAADFERGVTMRVTGGTGFPAAMAFGAAGKLDYAESFAESRRWKPAPSASIGISFQILTSTPTRRIPSSTPAPSPKIRGKSATWRQPTSAVPMREAY